ncbi:secreted RxLR effector peptide protein, putative [Phytophthora infestans T30-4]|uniref:RxLR effector protein n=1 Tax=Phytophthora infestans (strain T30-4) TaxID=403677 RepID=D0NQE1_PHYIT|nr:secreted RxLR effector peptide protein, putative [Phytophthora infestans T30-4]EEY62873.1 secreted RxLR effector peptide protein, putative [Phytophthora infestans T30-4]|eukprot:XP_002898748.1 secreted RxLR effector peptide protein, putative [Phytophthora infestans T30-4]
MRSTFYIVLVVAVLARCSAVAAFTNADESQLLSKVSPDFAVNDMTNTVSRKRSLRVAGPEDDDSTTDEEDRGFGSIVDVINAAEAIQKLSKASVKKVKQAGSAVKELTEKEKEALKALKDGKKRCHKDSVGTIRGLMILLMFIEQGKLEIGDRFKFTVNKKVNLQFKTSPLLIQLISSKLRLT